MIDLCDKLTLENFNLLASSVACITAAYVGIKGLNAWRAQLKGNQDYKLAKSLMLNIYKYQEAMKNLRSSAMWAFEYPNISHEEALKMSPEEKKYKENLYVYEKRWDRVCEIKPKIFEQTLEGQVIWGNDIKNLIENFLKLEVNVQFALTNYLNALNPDSNDSYKDENDKQWMNDSLDDEKDIYRRAFKEKLKAIEEYLKPKLKL